MTLTVIARGGLKHSMPETQQLELPDNSTVADLKKKCGIEQSANVACLIDGNIAREKVVLSDGLTVKFLRIQGAG